MVAQPSPPAADPVRVVEMLPQPVKQGIGVGSVITAAIAGLMFVLWLMSLWRQRKLTKAGEELTFDELTGVLRRAGGIAAIDREIARSRRTKTPLSVAFIDVDGLKKVNDGEGHAAGDKLLKGVAAHLQERLRGNDLVFRYGGDEFVCVLPEADQVSCERVFRRLRQAAAEKGFAFTYGVGSLRPDDDASSLLARADSALYETRSVERGVPINELAEQSRPELTTRGSLPKLELDPATES